MEEAISKPKVSSYLKNYFVLLKEYKLGGNKEVVRLEKIAKRYYDKVDEKTAANSQQA